MMRRRRLWKSFPVALALLAAACTSGGGGSTGGQTSGGTNVNGSGPLHLVMWMGYTPPPPRNTAQEYVSLLDMVKAYEKQHPNITIDVRYVNNDYTLQKVTVALQGNKQPDISLAPVNFVFNPELVSWSSGGWEYTRVCLQSSPADERRRSRAGRRPASCRRPSGFSCCGRTST